MKVWPWALSKREIFGQELLESGLITRTDVHEMLDGMSRTIFYRMRKQWQVQRTPFREPVQEIMPPKGGSLFRNVEVMAFFKAKGYL